MRIVLNLMLGLLACVNFAAAEMLTIQDSSGFTRSAEEVGGPSRVEFSLTDGNGAPADGTEVTLTSSSGEVLRATAVGGVVVFDAVAPGLWVVATTSQGVVFTSVVLAGGVVAGGLGGGIGAGAAILAVGGGAVAIATSQNDSGDDADLSPAS